MKSKGILPQDWECEKFPDNFHNDGILRKHDSFIINSHGNISPNKTTDNILGLPRDKSNQEIIEEVKNGTSIRKLGFDSDITIEHLLTLPKGTTFDLKNHTIYNELKERVDKKLNPNRYVHLTKGQDSKMKSNRKGFSSLVKKQVLINQNHECIHCHGFLTTVDFDHADGDRSNNDISNCKALCPNCHAYKSRHNIIGSFASVKEHPEGWVMKSKWYDEPNRLLRED